MKTKTMNQIREQYKRCFKLRYPKVTFYKDGKFNFSKVYPNEQIDYETKFYKIYRRYSKNASEYISSKYHWYEYDRKSYFDIPVPMSEYAK